MSGGLKTLEYWQRWCPKHYDQAMVADVFREVQRTHSQLRGRGMETKLSIADKLQYVADAAGNEHTVDEFRRRYAGLYYELHECLQLLQALGQAQVAWQRTLPGYRRQRDDWAAGA